MRNSLITILILSFLIIPVFSDDVPSSKGGFITIPPVQFYFHKGSYKGRLELISSPAKIWYCIQRADNDWRNKPLFVFFNGGPGSATSYGLMSLNTGKRTFDTLSEPLPVEFSENANSWSRMGNLLYIDARQTGFSYCTLDNGVEQQDERLREFNAQNFNSYFDAADFIRVLLAIFKKYPDIKGNRVVLVGESYGGNRATMMLYMLLNFDLLNTPTRYLNFEYQDPDLGRQLLAHFSSLYPDIRRSYPAEWVKQQFSHQVLIQPVIDRYNETLISGEMLVNEGSPVYELAEEVGIPFVPVHDGSSYFWQVLDYVSEIAKRDIYCYSKPVDWMWDIFMKAGFLLNNVDQLGFFLGHDLKLINDLYARNREKAYRVVDPTSYTDFGAGIPVTEKFLLTRYLQYQQKLKSLNNGNLHT
ncbi:MAG: hypothetical protein KAR14_15640, partial [Candidatus Aminicenantes bacterium]|nr:hypothetical protein [Candidatus Aminicenantes bacterium]